MENGGRQGWAADPFHLHEERYFSAGRPTKLVRDGPTETYDDPPSDPPAPPPTPQSTPVPKPTPAQQRTPTPPRTPTSQCALPPQREPGPGSAPMPPGKPRAGLFVAAALVVAVAVLAAVKLVHDSGSTADPNQAAPTTSPVAFVTRSAQQTLAQRTPPISLFPLSHHQPTNPHRQPQPQSTKTPPASLAPAVTHVPISRWIRA